LFYIDGIAKPMACSQDGIAKPMAWCQQGLRFAHAGGDRNLMTEKMQNGAKTWNRMPVTWS